MDKEDARRLPAQEQHQLRKQAIRSFKRSGNRRRVSEEIGLSYRAVCQVVERHQAGGAEALRPRTRGRRTGDKRSLSAEQERMIRNLICEKRPEQLKLDFALWSRPAVLELIERECGSALSVRAVGNYLKRWGFTPQKPIRRAYEQRPAAVQAWLNEPYPAIAAQAKSEGGEIHWGDETALVNTDVRGRSYAPKGKTPVIKVAGGTREKFSMLAAVTNQGKARWMIIDEAFKADRLIEFMQSLVQDAGRKVFLILDNLRVHHSKPAKAWLAERQEQIEVFYLPSYSPELNPEERLNSDLKQATASKAPARTRARLGAAAVEHMTWLEQTPERSKAYFQDPRVQYAA
jgi:transposase